MTAVQSQTRATRPVKKRPRRPEQRPETDAASKRFVRNVVWVLVVCGLFMGGQVLRYLSNLDQLDEIRRQTDALYVSVLGPDIGTSPFGRLQFEQGKLSATHRVGFDPLSVLAALSRPADENMHLDGLTLQGLTGRVRGFFGPRVDLFEQYLEALSDDEQYSFSLDKREEVFGGITFSLIVEPK